MRGTSATYVVTIETGWLDRMREETLYLYEMPVETFSLYMEDIDPPDLPQSTVPLGKRRKNEG